MNHSRIEDCYISDVKSGCKIEMPTF